MQEMLEMGLKERQHINRITNEDVPDYNTRLQKSTGQPIVFDNNWETFEDDIDAIFVVNGMMNKAVNAIEWVSRDEIGKAAIGSQIERIVLHNLGNEGQKKIQLEEKTLHLYSQLSGDDWDQQLSDHDIITWLENNL